MGPTASGKSSIAMQLRSYLPIELISVDSALIYTGMDIGTSKPNASELKKHPHKLIDIRDPSDFYSVLDFRNDALKAIEEIFNMNKIPCLVGGTMFYYHVLLNGISYLPKSNIILRNKLLCYKNLYDNNFLHQLLSYLDVQTSYKIHVNDTQRLLRALEICLITGKKMNQLKNKKFFNFPYSVVQIVIIKNQFCLMRNIERRIYSMLNNGLELEVRRLFERGDLNLNLPSMRCIGYRQMWLYFLNKLSYNEMIQKIITATWQLSKRQMTWLKRWNNLNFIYDMDIESCIDIILKIISKNKY
ncbi:tRNA (adenosine(37)-N6)-dimethylallyltransferase MiaA [Buchnera aphidicola]|uniref:tRNA (adenosine(37)-N6)-dimethylallyltransferase MiaA n=1 Tax=Buchnera aphidicola TaxID=9 RepID=UPI00346473BE